MTRLMKVCGLSVLAIGAVCAASQAEAGWRRWNCNYGYSGYQSSYYAPGNYSAAAPAPAVTDTAVVTDGRQRYQSGYQAAAPVAANPVYVVPAQPYYSGPYYRDSYYHNDPYYYQPKNAFDPSAARKALDGRMQH